MNSGYCTVLMAAPFFIHNQPISICSCGGLVWVDCDVRYTLSYSTRFSLLPSIPNHPGGTAKCPRWNRPLSVFYPGGSNHRTVIQDKTGVVRVGIRGQRIMENRRELQGTPAGGGGLGRTARMMSHDAVLIGSRCINSTSATRQMQKYSEKAPFAWTCSPIVRMQRPKSTEKSRVRVGPCPNTFASRSPPHPSRRRIYQRARNTTPTLCLKHPPSDISISCQAQLKGE